MNKRKILESAQKHQQRGALDKALEDYQTLLKADPKDSNIRLKVGDLHLKLGRTQDAIDAYLRVAQQFTAEGFDAKAVALYKQVTKLDEKRYEVHAQLGDLYQRMGLTSEAMKATQLAADGAHRAGDKEEALSLLRRMAALDPANTTNRLKVADLLRAEGRADDALAEYEEVVRELERQQNVEEQIKVLERALELEPGRAKTLRALAAAATAGGAYAKAERAVRTLLDASPDDLEALEMLGTALERAERTEEATEVFRSLAERFRARGDEDRARALVQRWGVAEAFGDSDSSAPALEGDASDLTLDPALDESLGLAPSGSEADASAEIELDDGALTDMGGSEAILEDSPSEQVLHFEEDAAESSGEIDGDADLEQLLAEASVFARYGKHERAIEALRTALRVEPGSAQALEKLGESLVAIGNRPHASSALQRAGAAYAASGDPEAVARVRALLQPIDPKAAAALEVREARAPEAPADEGSGAASLDEGDDLDIVIDSDVELEREPEAVGAAASSVEDFAGVEIEVSSGFAEEPTPEALSDPGAEAVEDSEQDFSFGSAERAPTSTPAVAKEATPAAPRAEADFEEAEFYRDQGLLEEARSLYERVLEAMPDHPRARARLDEIADLGAASAAAAEPQEQALPEPDASVVPEEEAPEANIEIDFQDEPEPESAADSSASEDAADRTTPQLDAPAPPSLEAEGPSSLPTATAELPDLGGDDFDLAAELSGVLTTDSASQLVGGGAEREAFEEVFAAFKEGVKREVGAADYEAHYDLGIAYKEMGLLDDAIGEFRAALGDPGRRIACLHLLGVCALDLGRHTDATAHLGEALAGEALPAEQDAALRLDLGRAYHAGGDAARARTCYEKARRLAPGLGGLDELLAELDRAAAESSGPDDAEGFESFDDLIETPSAEDGAPAPEAPSYESFEDLVGEDEPLAPASAADSAVSVSAAESAPPAAAIPEDARTDAPSAEEPPPEPAPPPREPPAAEKRSAPTARRRKKISFV